jgi:hypothetical protein
MSQDNMTKGGKYMRKLKLPSPALAISVVALFVALSGTAFAVGDAIVPLAKRALNADNAKHAPAADSAKKLGAAASGEIVQQAVSQASQAPGPASTAAGLVVIKTSAWTLQPRQEGNFTTTCDAGQKAIGGGWSDPGDYSSSYQSLPTGDGSGWTMLIYTSSFAPGAQSGTMYAICLK